MGTSGLPRQLETMVDQRGWLVAGVTPLASRELSQAFRGRVHGMCRAAPGILAWKAYPDFDFFFKTSFDGLNHIFRNLTMIDE